MSYTPLKVNNPNLPYCAPNHTPSKPLAHLAAGYELAARDLRVVLETYPDTVERTLVDGTKGYFSRLALPDCRGVAIVVNSNLGDADGVWLYPYTGVKAYRVYGDVPGTPLPELLRKLVGCEGDELLFTALGRPVDREEAAP